MPSAIRLIVRCLLTAWRAFVALARKRSTNCWWWAISRSRLAISFSRRSRSPTLGLQEGGVVPGVELHRLVVDVEDAGRHVVEEPVVVGDHHQHPREVAQPGLQPADGEDVQVVGRLVQEQGVGVAGQHLRQQHAQPEAAREGRQGIVVHPRRQAQALEDGRRPGFGGVAVEALGPGLELGEAVGVEALPGLGQQGLLLGQDLPQLAVAHEGHVEDRVLLVEELVLAQHADAGPLGQADLAVAGLQLTGEDVEQRRLAGAVGADEAVALPGVEHEGDIGEEGAVAVDLGEVRDREHERETKGWAGWWNPRPQRAVGLKRTGVRTQPAAGCGVPARLRGLRLRPALRSWPGSSCDAPGPQPRGAALRLWTANSSAPCSSISRVIQRPWRPATESRSRQRRGCAEVVSADRLHVVRSVPGQGGAALVEETHAAGSAFAGVDVHQQVRDGRCAGAACG